MGFKSSSSSSSSDNMFFKVCTSTIFPLIRNCRSYSVVVITFGFDPDNPGSNPGRTFLLVIILFYLLKLQLLRGGCMQYESNKRLNSLG